MNVGIVASTSSACARGPVNRGDPGASRVSYHHAVIRTLLADYPAWERLGLSLGFALAVSFLVAEVVARGIRVILRALLGRHDDPAALEALVRPVRYARAVVLFVVLATLVSPALALAGFDYHLGLDPESLIAWFFGSGLRIVLVAGLAWLVVRITGILLTRIEREVARSNTPDALERARRLRTLGSLVRNVVGIMVTGTAILMVLRELRIDIVPLLTGAGIAGLAIGFGAQTLVKDVISGFFIILENQVRVGDVAVINGTGGLVEDITLRTIVLRDMEGTVHVFPNGGINTLANRSKDFSYAVIDVSVAYREDTDRVSRVLREVGDDVRKAPGLGDVILEPLEVLGVDAFNDSGVVIKTRIKTLPLKQWDVGRELRRRIKQRFDAEGIEIPFPQVSLSVRTLANAMRAGDVDAPGAGADTTRPAGMPAAGEPARTAGPRG